MIYSKTADVLCFHHFPEYGILLHQLSRSAKFNQVTTFKDRDLIVVEKGYHLVFYAN